MENAFNRAVSAGVSTEDMQVLACIIKTAHCSSDVWAGCRAVRATLMHMGEARDFAGYLRGRHFEGWFDENLGHIDALKLDDLRNMACSFLGEL